MGIDVGEVLVSCGWGFQANRSLLAGGKDGYEGVDFFRKNVDGALCKCRLKLGGDWIFASNLPRNRIEGKVAAVNYRILVCA